MILQDVFQDFLLTRRLKGLAPSSIKDYQNFIQRFVDYFGSQTDIRSITYKRVVEYLNDVLSRPLSRATQGTYIRYAKIFLVWIRKKYGRPFEPSEIPVPKQPKKIVHQLNDTEIQNLFNMATSRIPWINARNYCMIALMYDSGIRQSEVCGLRKDAIDYERMLFKVTGKGAKDRLVPLGAHSLKLLREYSALCPYKNSEYVFVDRCGKRISANTVKVFVNRLKHESGIDFSSHKLRHNFATNYCIDNIRATGQSNVYDLSIMMGHESIETTKRYEHFAHGMLAIENRHSHLDKIYQGK